MRAEEVLLDSVRVILIRLSLHWRFFLRRRMRKVAIVDVIVLRQRFGRWAIL